METQIIQEVCNDSEIEAGAEQGREARRSDVLDQDTSGENDCDMSEGWADGDSIASAIAESMGDSWGVPSSARKQAFENLQCMFDEISFGDELIWEI